MLTKREKTVKLIKNILKKIQIFLEIDPLNHM
jgi:hypothetical protein